jgi:PAS domain S-box-containing protein
VRLLLTVLLALMLCTVLAAPGAADEPEIRVGVSRDFRPYAFTDKDGRPVGYAVDLIQAVARAMGLRVQITAGTWDEVWHGLAQGQIDVLAIVAKTPDWESQMDFSVPHTETYDAFFVRTGQPPIPNLAAAAGKEIVVRRSDVALKMLPRNFSGKLTLVDTIPQGLALVAAGQHDAFLTSKLIGTLEMRDHQIPGLTAGAPIPDYKRVFAFAVRKGNTELLEKLNQGLRIVKANGEYDRIYQQWLEVQPENRWQKMVPYLRWAIAAIVLLVVLAGGLQWLVRLRTRQLVRANEQISAEVAERRKAEAALQQANLTLEQRVAERTAKLQESEETLLRAAQALAASERRLQLFIEHAPAALAMFDRQMCYLYASDRWLTDYGLQRRDLKGLSHYEVFPEIPEVWKEAHRRGLAGEVLRAENGRFVRGDGSVQWLRWEIRPWHNDAGEIGGIVIFTEDITERKRAQEALRENEERLRMQMERMPIGCILFDGHSRFSQMNPAAERIFGYTAEELRRQHANVIVPEAMRPQVDGILRRLAQGDMTAHSVNENVAKDGRAIICEWTNTPLRDSAGNFIGFLSMVQDITERKQTEQALIRSEKLASVGRMAASIAHEINNPLAAVVNTIYLARTCAPDPESIRQYLETADEELRRISHITQQTLGFHRGASAPTAVSVSAALDSAVDLLRGKIRLRNARVEKKYKSDAQVMGVSNELRQVFANILANSLEAIADNGAIKLHISRSTCMVSGIPHVRVAIADNGKGIDPATLPRIFEPLFSTKESTGSGLGLWVSKQIIEKHKGAIRMRSSTKAQHRGTTFCVIIPVSAEQTTAQARAAAAT